VLHGGVEQGTPALSEDEIDRRVADAEAAGHLAQPHGEDWLIVLR